MLAPKLENAMTYGISFEMSFPSQSLVYSHILSMRKITRFKLSTYWRKRHPEPD
jgi:hypothetical protein